MKIRTSDLTGTATAKLTSGLTPLNQTTGLISSNEHAASSGQVVDNNGYDELVFTYINTTDYEIAPNIREAIRLRMKGERFLSLREADILARGNVMLKKGGAIDSIMLNTDSSNMLCEGTPGCDSSGWHLRFRYNNGIKWMSDSANKMTLATKDGRKNEAARIDAAIIRGGKILDKVRSCLDNLMLHLWPNEIVAGFKPFLLKPEFMTIEEYSKITGTKIEVNAEEYGDILKALGGPHA